MNRTKARPAVILGGATLTAVVCALGLRWIDGASPAQAASQETPAVVRAQDGHYWAEVMIEGRPMRMLVDTGASVVTLGRTDAEKAGLLVGPGDFTQSVQTAGGTLKAAPVVLSSLKVGGIERRGVEALVVDAELNAPLLGMSYLGRLSGFEARADGLRFTG